MIILEVSFGNFDENDIVRLQDKYNRIPLNIDCIVSTIRFPRSFGHFFVSWLISWSDVTSVTYINVMDDIVDEIGNILSIFVGEDNIIHVARIINVMDNIVDEIGNILSIFVGKDNVVYIHVARITY